MTMFVIRRTLSKWKMEEILQQPRYYSSQMNHVPAIQSSLLSNNRSYSTPSTKKPERVIIIGSGWAGFKFLQDVDQRAFQVIVVSPRNYFLFTPLLASTCVGTLEFRSIIEPVRSASQDTTSVWSKIYNIFHRKNQTDGLVYYEASVNSIDVKNQSISCKSALSDGSNFKLDYDHLVIACGAVTNTFGIPGVEEHAHFLKDIKDARGIRYRILERFEQAASASVGTFPEEYEKKIRQLLHFVVVGGGPTGVEFSAELHDFIKEDLSRLYPKLMDKVHMSLIDVAPKILSTFDKRLSDYTTNKFSREGMSIRTGTFVQKVEANQLIIKDGPPIPYGLLVWATGLSPNPLVSALKGKVTVQESTGRLLTDGYFRLMTQTKEKGVSPISNVFAIGDCGTIEDKELPSTAQVAKQKAKVLAKYFNDSIKKSKPIEQQRPFSYHDLGSMAYIGGWKAIVAMPISSDGQRKWNESGVVAWLLWRSAYFSMTVSWRNKALIPYYWFLTWFFGRDMTHIK